MSLFSPVLTGLKKIGLHKATDRPASAAVARACLPVERCLLEQLEQRRLLASNGLQAEYFNGKNFDSLQVTRVDPTIDFNWNQGSPAAGVNSNFFSARWIGKIAPPATGTYTFYTQSDDGIRVWVNNQLVINNWTDHASTENSGSITLTDGQLYDIRVEYYEGINDALARLSWAGPGFSKEVVPNRVLFTPDATDPLPLLPTVNLSVSKNSVNELASDTVTVTVTRTGSLLGALLVPIGQSGSATVNQDYTFQGSITIPGGAASASVTFRPIEDTLVEGNETATLSITPSSSFIVGSNGSASITIVDNDTTNPPVDGEAGLKGEYFGGRNFDTKVLERIDTTVNFDWGYGIPATGMPGDNFSARWTGFVTVPTSGRWTFLTESDDGVRLWVNGQQLVNQWNDHAPTEHSGSIDLVAGVSYAIRMEYYEAGNGAMAKLRWQGPGTARQVVPTSALSSTGSTTPAPVLPKVVLTSSDITGSESGDPVSFTVTRLAVGSEPLTVFLTYGGTATAADFTSGLPGSVVIPAGQVSTTIVLTPKNDDLVENTEVLIPAIASHSSYEISIPSNVTLGIVDNDTSEPPAGTGIGLRGEYFRDRGLTNKAFERVDSTIDFDWGYGSPGSGVGADNFSVQWSGSVVVPQSGVWTFYTTSDDGIRLWVSGQLLIDQWNDHAPTEHSASIMLPSVTWNNIRIEYYEAGNGAVAKLMWSGPGTPKQVVPSHRLLPPSAQPTLPLVTITSSDKVGNEGKDPFSFTLTRTGSLSNPLTVQLEHSGTVSEADITGGIPTQVTIPAGQSSVTVVLNPVDDALTEIQETLRIAVVRTDAYATSGNYYVTLELNDNDAGTLQVVPGERPYLPPGFIREGSQDPVHFVIVRTGSVASDLTVPLIYSGTSSPEDFTWPLPASVTIPAGRDRVEVIQSTVRDDGFEGTESLRVTLGAVNGYGVVNDGFIDLAIRDGEYDMTWEESTVMHRGLRGHYANGTLRSSPIVMRVDPSVNFNWGAGSPDPKIASDDFSVTWNAYLTPPATGTWTFYVKTTEKFQFLFQTINPNPGVYRSEEGSLEEFSVEVNLEGGKSYPIALLYEEIKGNAQVELSWSGPGVSKQLVPTSALRATKLGYAMLMDMDEDGDESGNQVSFRVYHSPALSYDREVFLKYSGTATADDFLEDLPTRVVVPAGEAYALVTLTPRKDDISEGTEFLTPHILPSSNYDYEPTSPMALAIRD